MDDASTPASEIRDLPTRSTMHTEPAAVPKNASVPAVIGAARGENETSNRRLVVCIDGTLNQSSKKNTNVIELYNLIKKDDTQLTYYNNGFGAFAKPSWRSYNYVKQVVLDQFDLATTWNLGKVVIGAYHWLLDTYRPGDQIFLFGFSPGAYQVQALAALIDRVGLLYPGNQVQIPFVWELYTSHAEPDLVSMFKKTFCYQAVDMHFLGAWNTVSPKGRFRGKLLSPTQERAHITHIRHAFVLDERRVEILPEYVAVSQHLKQAKHSIKEAWFAGKHSDIGGGLEDDISSDIGAPSLIWMIDEANDAGLKFEYAGADWRRGLLSNKIGRLLVKYVEPFPGPTPAELATETPVQSTAVIPVIPMVAVTPTSTNAGVAQASHVQDRTKTSPETVRISSLMSASDIAAHLADHGCENITGRLDVSSCSIYPIYTGGFGDVYRGKLNGGTPVAIKTMRLQIEGGQKSLKHAAQELHTWSKCRHPNVVELLGLVEFRGQIGMVSPWMENGSLRPYLNQHPNVDRCKIIIQISEGLAYLHHNNIIHGDLKGLNVLISDEGIAAVADFGSAVLKDSTLQFTATADKHIFSPRWAAPEIIKGTGTYSFAADVYALGMTILETITGEVPYVEKADLAVCFAVVVGREHPQRPKDYIPLDSHYGNILWSMLTRCWAFEAEARPGVNDVVDIMKTITRQNLMHTSGVDQPVAFQAPEAI